MENKYVIKINQVTKQFKSVFAVKNLSSMKINICVSDRPKRRDDPDYSDYSVTVTNERLDLFFFESAFRLKSL